MTLLQRFRGVWSVMVTITLLGTLLMAIAPLPTIAAPLPLPIYQARQAADDLEVVVAGVVTVPSGRFTSASFDQGFAIQDASGGIYVTTNQTTSLQPGDPVRVRGTIHRDGHGQRVMHLESWRLRQEALPAIAPQVVSVSRATKALAGSLVTVQGTISRGLVADAPFGDRLWLTDDTGTVQIYMPRSAQIHPETNPHLTPGRSLQVTGLSSQYDLNSEVMPRGPADIQVLDSDKSP